MKIRSIIILFFFITNTNFSPLYAQGVLSLPQPGTMVELSAPFYPIFLKGIRVFPDEPFHFDFIVDTGDSQLEGQALKDESLKLMKYFLTALTVPEDHLWVNLSPYEQERIIQDDFGKTEMGRDLLAQDYLLKQITASLMYPENELGRAFWDDIYKKAYEQYGTTDIPFNTFNKVWIVPDEAAVYENGDSAFVTHARLKVLLEEDYLALNQNRKDPQLDMQKLKDMDNKQVNDMSSEIVKKIILPTIEKEVNEGKNFAQLRQIYHSLILATWFKLALKESFLDKIYVDQDKLWGLKTKKQGAPQEIYEEYLKVFQQGVFDYIKEEYDPYQQQVLARKYFSGGFTTHSLAGDLSENLNRQSPREEVVFNGNVFSMGTFIDGSTREGRLKRQSARSPREESFFSFGTASKIVEMNLQQRHEEFDVAAGKVSKEFLPTGLGGSVEAKVLEADLGTDGAYYYFSEKEQGWVIVLNSRAILRIKEKQVYRQEALFHEATEISLRQQFEDLSEHRLHVIVSALQRMVFSKDGQLTVYDQYQLNEMWQGELEKLKDEWEKGKRKWHHKVLEKAVQEGIVIDLERVTQYEEKFYQEILRQMHLKRNLKILPTDVTLDYGGIVNWTVNRILSDLVQNHLDDKESKIDIVFYLNDGRILNLLDPGIKSLSANEVASIEISDDGIGYDYQHLKYFLSTKKTKKKSGKFGEGLKMATLSCLLRGIEVEYQSRNWKANPSTMPIILNEGYPNEMSSEAVQFQVREEKESIEGSVTRILRPSEELVNAAKQLTDLVIVLRENYQPLASVEDVGEIVEVSSAAQSPLYVKGHRIMYLPKKEIGIRERTLFVYNFYDDEHLNRDRDYLPNNVIEASVKKLFLEGMTPETIKIFLTYAVRKVEKDQVHPPQESIYENGVSFYSFELSKMNEQVKQMWREQFLKVFGKDALLGISTRYGYLADSTKQAIGEGKKVIVMTDTAYAILEACGADTTSSHYFEKENRVDTMMSLTYREKAWGVKRLLLDAVQNHLKADSGATELHAEFLVEGQEEWMDLSKINDFDDQKILAIRFRDNGKGYDYRLLGVLHDGKKDIDEAAGKWGEGLKLLSKAAVRLGMEVELRSRGWRAKAVTNEKYYEDADGKTVALNILNYDLAHFKNGHQQGSQTIFRKPTLETIQLFRQLIDYVIQLKSDYVPVSRTAIGDIISLTKGEVFDNGIKVEDSFSQHHLLLGYNFVGVEDLVPSPDRNVINSGKLKESVRTALSSTESVEALAIVIRTALRSDTSYLEFQNYSQHAGYSNEASWKAAWQKVIEEKGWDKIVLGTNRSRSDMDAQIVLKHMGYTIIWINTNLIKQIHSLGVHYDSEVLEKEYEMISPEELTEGERNILKIREIIDRQLSEHFDIEIEQSPIDIIVAVRSKVTGEELAGLGGHWDGKHKRIAIARARLQNAFDFGEVYLEEMGHRLSEAGDYEREFTNFFRNAYLTEIFRKSGLGDEVRLPKISGRADDGGSHQQQVNIEEPALMLNVDHTTDTHDQVMLTKDVGGIDLNTADMKLKVRKGNQAISLAVDESYFLNMHLEGFVPMIIHVTPIQNPLVLFE